MHIDTRSLISEVQKRPHLWNPSTREYRLRDARMASWMDICVTLVKNFGELDNRAQDKMVLKIRTRWKTARDTFMKINNNLKGRTKKASRYYYFEQLQFLKQVKRTKKAPNKPRYPRKKGEDPLREETPEIKQEDRAETPEIEEQETPMIKIEDNSNDVMLACDQTIPSSNANNNEQVKEEEEEADCAFLRSLLPTLRKFDDNQKLNFRMDVLQIIMRLRNSQKSSTLLSSLP